MAYKALYRKYRPKTFDEVCGQDHIVKTLQNAIRNDKLAHAYLFCGPRGTGKTSIAKLLAKTLNCENPDHKPCGECSSCIEIQESINPDVIELDGATNNGVDEIRNLVESVKYAPIHGRYKVYIIDEVHMITPNAFNALLKTLEEPPEYCVFIMATTDPQKVLPTIVSRCQRFDFKKLTAPIIKERIKYICDKESIRCDEAAAQLISELADGGMRDALSILDQCVAYAEDNITVKDVSDVYGVASVKEKMDIFRAVKEKNITDLVNKVNDFATRGLDLPRLMTDLVNIAKEAVIYSYSKDPELLENINESQAQTLLKDFEVNQLLKHIDYLMESGRYFRDAVDVVSYVEVCFLKMIGAETDKTTTTVEIRQIIPEIKSEPEKKETAEEPVKVIPKRENREIKKTEDDEFLDILLASTKAIKEADRENWNEVINCRDPQYLPVVSMLNGSTVMADSPDTIIVTVGERIVADNINEVNNNRLIEELTQQKLGVHKNVIAITSQQQDYLINYFKTHRNDRRKPKTEEKPAEPAEPVSSVVDNLEKLFGKDGFDVYK